LKNGLGVHNYRCPMELAVKKLKENRKVNRHDRYKTFRFIDSNHRMLVFHVEWHTYRT